MITSTANAQVKELVKLMKNKRAGKTDEEKPCER